MDDPDDTLSDQCISWARVKNISRSIQDDSWREPDLPAISILEPEFQDSRILNADFEAFLAASVGYQLFIGRSSSIYPENNRLGEVQNLTKNILMINQYSRIRFPRSSSVVALQNSAANCSDLKRGSGANPAPIHSWSMDRGHKTYRITAPRALFKWYQHTL